MIPIVNGLEAEYEGVDFIYLKAIGPENLELQQRYGVRGHPTFVILGEGGKVVQTFIGPQQEDALRAALDKANP